jgi:opacity protein-like surface antigen
MMVPRSALLAALSATVLIGRSADAQYVVRDWYQPQPTVTITPYVGYANFNHYIDGPLGSSASGSGAALTGAQINLNFNPYVALVGNLAYANTGLVFFVPGGEPTRGSSGVWLYDGDVQFSAPFRGMRGQIIKPFVQLGLGAINYTTQNDLGSASASSFAFNYGAGVDFPITRSIGIRILAKDYVARWYDGGYITPDGYAVATDQLTNNVAITGGLRVSLR